MANETRTCAVVHEALGRSEAFLAFQERLADVAKVNRPVVIVGERGSGKEVAAVRLHYHSHRWQGPLVAVNCAAFSESLLESELFGHEPGAFTGAIRLRRGRFEIAHKGTLFLDEIGTMPMAMQEKILRVAEYQVVERLGGSKALDVDVRIIAATNADLKAMTLQGRFRADLLDRLAFEVLRVPPLRERTGDIALLAEHFAARMAVEMGRPEPPRFAPSAMKNLATYAWPGNVRELKNVVERAVFREAGAKVISQVTIDPFDGLQDNVSRDAAQRSPNEVNGRFAHRASGTEDQVGLESEASSERLEGVRLEGLNLPGALVEMERRYLRQALLQARFNQRRAAELLGLRYNQFRGLYRKHAKTLCLSRED